MSAHHHVLNDDDSESGGKREGRRTTSQNLLRAEPLCKMRCCKLDELLLDL
jgi:hypothetical protein